MSTGGGVCLVCMLTPSMSRPALVNLEVFLETLSLPRLVF